MNRRQFAAAGLSAAENPARASIADARVTLTPSALSVRPRGSEIPSSPRA